MSKLFLAARSRSSDIGIYAKLITFLISLYYYAKKFNRSIIDGKYLSAIGQQVPYQFVGTKILIG